MPPPSELYRCMCCGCHTLPSRHRFETCVLCRWQDELPNGNYSLTAARENVEAYGIMYGPADVRFANLRHPILGPAGEYAIDRVALRARAYIEFRAFGANEGARASITPRLTALLEAISAADRLYSR